MKLYIGSKRYSSWSLRAWIALKEMNVDFEEILIPFKIEPGSRKLSRETLEKMEKVSPSRKLPCLQYSSDQNIHDSLAICEYVNKLTSDALWPSHDTDGIRARSIAYELHSDFHTIRRQIPFCCGQKAKQIPDRITDALGQDIERLENIVLQTKPCFEEESESYLFGKFTIVDSMLIPYIIRLHQVNYPVKNDVKIYMNSVLNNENIIQWMNSACNETIFIEEIELMIKNFPKDKNRSLVL